MKSNRIGRRFVPSSTIERRVQASDDRYAADLRRRQARAAVGLPYVHDAGASAAVDREIAAEVAAFRTFLRHPATGAKLDALLADNRATDAAIEREREEAVDDGLDGSTCGSNCGFCGRCN